MKLEHRRYAFTIVELIMVVVLIGIIAVFAIPGYTKSVAKSYEKAASNNLFIINSAQKLKKNAGAAAYVDGATTADVNTNLSLGIIENNVTYLCKNATAAAFDCRATYGTTFVLKTTEANPSAVCCCPGSTCYVTTTACGACL